MEITGFITINVLYYFFLSYMHYYSKMPVFFILGSTVYQFYYVVYGVPPVLTELPGCACAAWQQASYWYLQNCPATLVLPDQ